MVKKPVVLLYDKTNPPTMLRYEDGTLIDETDMESIYRWLKKRLNVFYVYIAQSNTDSKLYKVGISKNIARRMKQLDTTLIHKIRIGSREGAQFVENELHVLLEQLGLHAEGEWFYLDQHPEIDVVAKLKQLRIDGDVIELHVSLAESGVKFQQLQKFKPFYARKMS